MGEGMLIICPAAKITDGEFSEQILTELIEEGYSGTELLSEFKRRQARVRPAVETLLENAKMVAEGRAEYSTYEDVFGMD